jgi:hypothetical protein
MLLKDEKKKYTNYSNGSIHIWKFEFFNDNTVKVFFWRLKFAEGRIARLSVVLSIISKGLTIIKPEIILSLAKRVEYE